MRKNNIIYYRVEDKVDRLRGALRECMHDEVHSALWITGVRAVYRPMNTVVSNNTRRLIAAIQ